MTGRYIPERLYPGGIAVLPDCLCDGPHELCGGSVDDIDFEGEPRTRECECERHRADEEAQ